MGHQTTYDIKPLFRYAGVKTLPSPGVVTLEDRMEVPEPNPADEWISLGLRAMNKLQQDGFAPRSAADVGTGNGILAIGIECIFHPSSLYLTDIVGDVLGPSAVNFFRNIGSLKHGLPAVRILQGRDADPLPHNLDLIVFSPPPLMVGNETYIEHGLSRTTMIERDEYAHLTSGPNDHLSRWSTLPWYGFLCGAKEKLSENGVILGLYSGRVPFHAISEAYDRAGLQLGVPFSIVKKQQDPQFLQQYARYEKEHLGHDSFDFYDYGKAEEILCDYGLEMGVLKTPHHQLKQLLMPAKISANQAYEKSKHGQSVAHIGHALLGTRDYKIPPIPLL